MARHSYSESMKRHLWALAVCCLLCSAMAAGTSSTPQKTTKPPPGVEMAQALTTITGVAISPLLGVSAVGAWHYFRTDASQRGNLSWFAQPWFWVTGLLIVALVFAKDVFGAGLPPGWKKPFDVAELIENKLSALVAAGAFVPLFASVFEPLKTSSLASMGFAAIDMSSVYNVLVMPFALAVFVVVFLASHAINILILLSPWGAIDAALKAARTALLSLLTLVSFINPWLGAIFSIVVIIVAWFIAGWSFRLMVFGSIFSWDFVTLRRTRCTPEGTEHRAFTAREIERTPIRSCGMLVKTANGFEFQYRPWLIFPKRVVKLLPGDGLAIGNGFMYPVMLRETTRKETVLLNFPPRYCGNEAALAKCYDLPLRDVGLYRGMKAAWQWLKELVSGKGKETVLEVQSA
jgi:MFS family permease